MKNSDIFHISVQNIDWGYSLELPQWGGSNEYPQSSRPRWLSWMRCQTDHQEVMIMKYFLRSFSPFRLFKKGVVSFWWKNVHNTG